MDDLFSNTVRGEFGLDPEPDYAAPILTALNRSQMGVERYYHFGVDAPITAKSLPLPRITLTPIEQAIATLKAHAPTIVVALVAAAIAGGVAWWAIKSLLVAKGHALAAAPIIAAAA
jgi:hypothetical protein